MKYLIYTSLLFFANTTFSQVEWIKSYGELESNEEGNAIRQTTDDGFIVAGTKDSELFVLKVDAYGNEEWSYSYPHDNEEEGSGIHQTSDGGYIVITNTNSGGTALGHRVLKIDALGTLAWEKTFNEGYYTDLQDIEAIGNNEFIIAGYAFLGVNTESFPYLLRIDEDGNEIWSNNYTPMNYNERIYDIHITNDNTIIATGRQSFTNSLSSLFAYAIKVDLDGNQIWANSYGEVWHNYDNYAVVELSDNNYLLTASMLINLSTSDMILTKVDQDGNELWRKIIQHPPYGHNTSSKSCLSADQFPVVCSRNGGDFTFTKFNLDGEAIWISRFERENIQFTSDIILCNDDGFAAVGFENLPNGTIEGQRDIVIIKSNQEGEVTSTKILKKSTISIQTTPNPTSDVITFSIKENDVSANYTIWNNTVLKIFNTKGQAILTNTFSQASLQISCTNLASGVYFYTLQKENNLIGTGKIIVDKR